MLKHSWPIISQLNKDLPEDPHKQQNATDFTCDSVVRLIDHPSSPAIFKNKTIHGQTEKQLPTWRADYGANGWYLNPGVYQAESNIWIEVPAGHAGWAVHRSSLNRNGVQVVSSLYDAGYRGPIGAIVYVHNPSGIFIETGARIGQFVLAEAETLSLYNGQYQFAERTDGEKENNNKD